MTTAAEIPAAVYARYSTDRQDARSIDDQIRRCRTVASGRGLKVVAQFSDAAESGAHLERADLQRLLAESRRGKNCPFRVVLVDDLSRLSRDLGNTWRIVFEELASRDVRVIDCTTGMASDDGAARLTFGAMALVNDTFLQLVRTETHRGLEGRALAGFWTGGRIYGYRTETEPNPPDPEHPRKVVRVDPAEAAIVGRVFRLYAAGQSMKKIAEVLNREGIRAPYDGDYGKPAGRGWGHTTIRAMLRNERYIGRMVWNRRKWERSPVTGKRVPRLRSAEDHVCREDSALAIVPPELWADVQERVAHARRLSSRPPGSGKHPNLLSGLLRCGLCGSSMVVVGATVKDGKRTARYGCAAHRSKGASICPNGLTVSDRKLGRALLDSIFSLVQSDDFRERFAEQFDKRLRSRRPAGDKERAALEAEVATQEARVRRVTDAFARVGHSDGLVSQLRQEEERLRSLRARLAEARRPEERAVTAPDTAKLLRYVRDIQKLAEAAPSRAREALARVLEPVTLHVVETAGKRSYEARGALRLQDPVSFSGDRVLAEKSGCGGRI